MALNILRLGCASAIASGFPDVVRCILTSFLVTSMPTIYRRCVRSPCFLRQQTEGDSGSAMTPTKEGANAEGLRQRKKTTPKAAAKRHEKAGREGSTQVRTAGICLGVLGGFCVFFVFFYFSSFCLFGWLVVFLVLRG